MTKDTTALERLALWCDLMDKYPTYDTESQKILTADIRALIKVVEAAKQVVKFTEPEWRDDIDRGDADIALAEALKGVE